MRKEITHILQYTIPNVDKMEELIIKDCATAMNLVNQPCGRFILSKTMVETYMTTSGITKEMIQSIIKKMPVTGWVTGNPFYNMLTLYLVTFLAANKAETAIATARFYSAVTCSYLKAKYFPICNEEALRYTLTQLHGASVAKEGFRILCVKVADATLYKYVENMINQLDKYTFYRYLVDVRNKLNQSVKIIAFKYYDIQQNKRETNFEDLAERIGRGIQTTASNPKIIEYVAREIGVSELEVELIFVGMIDQVDAILGMQVLILKLLIIYNGVENIEKIGIRALVNRAFRTQEIVKSVKDILDILQREMTMDDLKICLYLAVLLILSYR